MRSMLLTPEAPLSPMRSPRNSAHFDYRFKFVMLGSSGVGKTSLFERLRGKGYNELQRATIGVDQCFIPYRMEEKYDVQIAVWDTAGQERFASITNTYLRGAHAAWIVYSVNDEESFDAVWRRWLPKLQAASPDAIVAVVANQTDRDEKTWSVSRANATRICEATKCLLFETSARTNANVKEAMARIVDLLYKKATSPRQVATAAIADDDTAQSPRTALAVEKTRVTVVQFPPRTPGTVIKISQSDTRIISLDQRKPHATAPAGCTC